MQVVWWQGGPAQAKYQALLARLQVGVPGASAKEEVVFHGTPMANVDSIMKGGFRVGGVDGHAVSVGQAHGQGTPTVHVGHSPGRCCS